MNKGDEESKVVYWKELEGHRQLGSRWLVIGCVWLVENFLSAGMQVCGVKKIAAKLVKEKFAEFFLDLRF